MNHFVKSTITLVSCGGSANSRTNYKVGDFPMRASEISRIGLMFKTRLGLEYAFIN